MNTFLSLGDYVKSTILDTNYFDIGGLNCGNLETDVTKEIHSSLKGKYKLVLEYFGLLSKHDRMPLMPLPDYESQQFIRVLETLPIKELTTNRS